MLDGCTVAACASKEDTPKVRAVAAATDNKTRFFMMKKFGISYKSAGENIAQGQRTPEEVVQAWMNSAGHRANILNSGFTHIGVGYVESGNYWTQQFITK